MGKKKDGKKKKKGKVRTEAPRSDEPQRIARRKARALKKMHRKPVKQYCSKCGKPTAKPKAYLCRRCFKRWNGE